MILNVIKEGGYTSNNTDKQKEIDKDSNLNNVQLKKIKELINENDLRYVSDNVRQLLDIKKPNDPDCFIQKGTITRRVVQVGEKFRVILYVRLSQEDGDLEDGDVSGSIKNQLLYLLDECHKRDWVVVGIFCEEDISGVDDNRPEWLKSIKFAELGNTEIVLCKSQSRFTRSMEMVEKYLHKCFPEWHVRFLGLVDNSDTAVEANKKSRQINGLVNEWYVEDASKNTRATLKSMKENGQFTGSFPPYGYLIDPEDKHHLIPDLHAREAIKIMAGMLIHGKSLDAVKEVLMRKGFLTPADYKTFLGYKISRGKIITTLRYQVEKEDTLKSLCKKFYVTKEEIKQKNNLTSNTIHEGDILLIPHKQKWTTPMIRSILTDETQIGSLVQGKCERMSFKNKKEVRKPKEEWIIVPHCHEANLDLETFEKVNKLFVPKKKYRSQKDGNVPLFSRKVYCSCCGGALYKNTVKLKHGNKEYLHCKGNGDPKHGHICDNKTTIELGAFEKYIFNCIKEKINSYYELSTVSKEYYLQNVYSNIDNNIQQLEKEKLEIESEIKKRKNILVQLYADKVSGTLAESEFTIIKDSNTLEIDQLEKKLSNITTEINNLNMDKEKQEDKAKIFEKYKNITELNKLVLDTFISRIEVGKLNEETNERPIKIEWNLYTA